MKEQSVRLMMYRHRFPLVVVFHKFSAENNDIRNNYSNSKLLRPKNKYVKD